MNAGSANWNWPEVEGVLAAMSSDEEVPIVCGGQAVSFWAQRFGLHPVVSQNQDILFDRESAKRLADRLGGAASFPGRYDMTILTAVVRAVWKGRPLNIECLSSVPGIETDPESLGTGLEGIGPH